MLSSKLNRFPVKLELSSGADRFCPTFFVVLCTFANELSNVRARKFWAMCTLNPLKISLTRLCFRTGQTLRREENRDEVL